MGLLEAIFSDLTAEEGILVFSPTPHRRRLARSVPEALAIAASMNEEKGDAYFGVAPRALTDVEKVTRVPVVWLDLDSKDFPEGELDKLCGSPPVPFTYQVASGHGYHLYWNLIEPVDSERAGELMRALWQAHGAGAGGRTYNAKWILRVPGTTNYKVPEHPVPVTMKSTNERAIYKASDVLALTTLSKLVVKKLWQGGNQGFKSRSERDFWAVKEFLHVSVSESGIHTLFQILPVGDRYTERGGDQYLDRTIESARLQKPKAAAVADFIEQDGELCYKTSKGVMKVATFIFKPRKLIKVDGNDSEDQILGDITSHNFTWSGVALPKSAFNSVNALGRHLHVASWQWLASDREVKAWLPHLMDQLYDIGLPHAHGVSVIGRHENLWVAPECVFDAETVYPSDEAPYVFLSSGRETPSVVYTFPPADEYRKLVKAVTELLPQINYLEVIAPMVGWFFAAPIKGLLQEAGERFPILNVYGTQGSGKSSTLLRVLQPLVGWKEPRAYPSKTRMFVLLSMMASTNAVPISFGEFRDTAAHGQEEFLDVARRAYDVGRDSRGRPDQTTQSYDLDAPFSVDGEDAFSDPAIRERSVVVNMSLGPCQEGSATYKAFLALTRLRLVDFAGRYIQRTLRETSSSVKLMFDTALADLQMLLPMSMPDRIRRNLAVVLCGLKMYNAHAMEYNGTQMEVLGETWKHILERTLVSSTSGRTRILVDDFIEDVVAYASQIPPMPAYFLYYDAQQNVLWFHLTGAWGWWAAKRRREGRILLQIQAVRSQLRELQGSYIMPEQYIGTGSRTQRCVGVKVEQAELEGLDVPKRLRPFSEITLDVQ